jgi:hypothetical protein
LLQGEFWGWGMAEWGDMEWAVEGTANKKGSFCSPN